MPKYFIYAGLSGGFGGAGLVNDYAMEFKDEEAAEDFAREQAVSEYESYSGLHGLRNLDQIMEEEGIDEEEAEEIYNEEMESWIDYKVELVEENA